MLRRIRTIINDAFVTSTRTETKTKKRRKRTNDQTPLQHHTRACQNVSLLNQRNENRMSPPIMKGIGDETAAELRLTTLCCSIFLAVELWATKP